jgi:hypothetical protein
LPQPTKVIGLAPPLDERPVHGVLQHGRVPVVVLAGEHDVAFGAVERLAEAGHVVSRIVAEGAGWCRGVEERQRVVAQIEQLDLEIASRRELVDDPSGHPLAEATFSGRARDHLHQHP